MKYALVDNRRVEAFPKGRGVCLCCKSLVIAKCGRFKINHWAHKDKTECDPWWENESEWHRQWKNNFPSENQEIVFKSHITDEKHIADIYTKNKVVIEIQSYSIDDEERTARENFYGNMIWIVNGCKNDSDRIYFKMGICSPHTDDLYLCHFNWYGRGKIFSKWVTSQKPVFIDFGSDLVWNLISYNDKEKKGTVRAYLKEDFIKMYL